MIKNLYSSSCKVPFIPVRFQWNLNFLDRFLTITQISNFIQIRAVGAELFRADKQADQKKLMLTFVILRRCLKSGSANIWNYTQQIKCIQNL